MDTIASGSALLTPVPISSWVLISLSITGFAIIFLSILHDETR